MGHLCPPLEIGDRETPTLPDTHSHSGFPEAGPQCCPDLKHPPLRAQCAALPDENAWEEAPLVRHSICEADVALKPQLLPC